MKRHVMTLGLAAALALPALAAEDPIMVRQQLMEGNGANAAVVGVLLAAFWNPVCTAGITDARTCGLAVAAAAALFSNQVPVWAVVAASAALGAVML